MSITLFQAMRYPFDLTLRSGIYDLDTYMNPSIGYGTLLLIHKATKEPCGHISAVINQNQTGWISMFIVDAAHRGKGMGAELFKCAMADFERKGTKIQGLDGVVQQKNTYERRGFQDSPLGLLKLMMRPLVDKEPLPEVEGKVSVLAGKDYMHLVACRRIC
jgi:predicted GNAT family acetyltransferase